MDQIIFASLSHTHYYWYEVGMLKVPAVLYYLQQWTVLYCNTVIDHTGLCRQSNATRVFGLNLKDECVVLL